LDSTKPFYADFGLGILGGGQLAQMLIQACIGFNVRSCVLGEAEGPCSGIASEYHAGSVTDFDSVYAFGKGVDLLTVELENVCIEALKELEQAGVRVFPQASVIETIRNKQLQKSFYRDHDIPTADFVLVEDREAAQSHSSFLPAYHKLAVGGYDGNGVRRLSNHSDLESTFDAPGVLEELVAVRTEISVIAARNCLGEVAVYPPVECVFHPEHNLLDYLISPADISAQTRLTAEDLARQVVDRLGIVGILAVEMFVTEDGEVLVNEAAPRPHNSGHQTIEGNLTSQYEQHLRAILGLPLGLTDLVRPSALVNLLGMDPHVGSARFEGVNEVLGMEGASLHIYGKRETRPNRKMGHVTVIDDDIDRLRSKASHIREIVRVTT